MRRFLKAAVVIAAVMPFSAQAKELFIPVAGSVGNFKTDARIVNPTSAQITVNAQLVPTCGVNPDGSTSCPASTQVVVPIVVPARQMKVLDDVIARTMNSSGLAGLRLSTESADFTATARIFADTGNGTLGQFVTASQASEGLTKGILQQLKSNASFRTNVGMMNPNNTEANVTMFVHSGATLVKSKSFKLQPFAVIQPVNVTALYGIGSGVDLSDFWVSFESTQKIIAYGSVVDNQTTDPTYVAAVPDSGTDAQPAGPQTRTFDVTARDFTYTVTPGGKIVANAGDTVVLRLTSAQGTHGFQLSPFIGATTLTQGTTIERTFQVPVAGEFTYFCTVVCGGGHFEMDGLMTVNAVTSNGTVVEATKQATPVIETQSAEQHHHHH